MQRAGIFLLCAPVLHLVKWPPALGTQHRFNNLFTSLHLKPLQIWQNMTWQCLFCAHIWNSFVVQIDSQRGSTAGASVLKTYIFWKLFSVKNECVRVDQYFTPSKYSCKWFHHASTPLKLLYKHAENLVQKKMKKKTWRHQKQL